jgi:hypothetical protein
MVSIGLTTLASYGFGSYGSIIFVQLMNVPPFIMADIGVDRMFAAVTALQSTMTWRTTWCTRSHTLASQSRSRRSPTWAPVAAGNKSCLRCTPSPSKQRPLFLLPLSCNGPLQARLKHCTALVLPQVGEIKWYACYAVVLALKVWSWECSGTPAPAVAQCQGPVNPDVGAFRD